VGTNLAFCLYHVYANNDYEEVDKYLKLSSASPLCLSVSDAHTAFGFTVALPSSAFIDSNLKPWISIKTVGLNHEFIGTKSFRECFNDNLSMILNKLWPQALRDIIPTDFATAFAKNLLSDGSAKGTREFSSKKQYYLNRDLKSVLS
jgi:hypothetical protein